MGKIFVKIIKWTAALLIIAALLFIGLMAYVIINPEAGNQRHLPPPGQPVIDSINFPEKIPLNTEVDGTISFRDREGDIVEVRFEHLTQSLTSIIDNETLQLEGVKQGEASFAQVVEDTPRIIIVRFIFRDAAGHESKPYLLTYKGGDAEPFYEHYAKVIREQQPVSIRKKLHFFILEDTGTELAKGTEFLSESGVSVAASPNITTVLLSQVLPAINGIWDQCGVEFEAGKVEVVHPEKIKVGSTRTLASIFRNKDGKHIVALLAKKEGWTSDLDASLAQLGVGPSEYAVIIFGNDFWNLDLNKQTESQAISPGRTTFLSWRHLQFSEESPKRIILPENIMSTIAHEIGHNLNLLHPKEEKSIPSSQFDQFNLMTERGVGSELLPEQCQLLDFK